MARKVIRTRNGGRWTEAEYWSRVRSALRKAFSHWHPALQALYAARRPCERPGRQKWEVQCADCLEWCKQADMRKDHVVPVGSLKSPEDFIAFLERLTPEDPAAFQMLCKECHQQKTNAERPSKGS